MIVDFKSSGDVSAFLKVPTVLPFRPSSRIAPKPFRDSELDVACVKFC